MSVSQDNDKKALKEVNVLKLENARLQKQTENMEKGAS